MLWQAWFAVYGYPVSGSDIPWESLLSQVQTRFSGLAFGWRTTFRTQWLGGFGLRLGIDVEPKHGFGEDFSRNFRV